MTKPTRIKLKRNKRIELTLSNRDSRKMLDFLFDASKIGGEYLIGTTGAKGHTRINARWTGRTRVTITNGEDACTIVISVEE